MKFSGDQIVAAVVATSFAAGLNLYATVATLGLLARAGVLALPPALGILTNWWVIGVSAALFAIEFFADKIPAFDLVWNTLHTFIRFPVAALLAYRATAALSPVGADGDDRGGRPDRVCGPWGKNRCTRRRDRFS